MEDLLSEIYVSLTILGAPSELLASFASAGKEIDMQQGINDLRRWNQYKLNEMNEKVKLFSNPLINNPHV